MTRSANQMMPLRPKRFQDHLRGKKGEILLAAFQCIAEKGIAATSTYAIAARAGLNQGIIHYYFKSKDELLKHLMEILFQNFFDNINTIAASKLSPVKKLERMLESGYTLIGSRRVEFIVMIAFWAHAISIGGDMLILYKKLFRRFRKIVIKTLEEGEKISELKKGVSESVASFVVAGVQGLGLQYVLDPEEPNIEKWEAFLKDLLRYAMRGDSE